MYFYRFNFSRHTIFVRINLPTYYLPAFFNWSYLSISHDQKVVLINPKKSEIFLIWFTFGYKTFDTNMKRYLLRFLLIFKMKEQSIFDAIIKSTEQFLKGF